MDDSYFNDPTCADRPERLAKALVGIFVSGKWRVGEIEELARLLDHEVDNQLEGDDE